MRYTKPAILNVVNAQRNIMGGGKPEHPVFDNADFMNDATAGAYESDE